MAMANDKAMIGSAYGQIRTSFLVRAAVLAGGGIEAPSSLAGIEQLKGCLLVALLSTTLSWLTINGLEGTIRI
jgi:hypothetical protein